MKYFLYLDPLVLSDGFIAHRIPVFQKLAITLLGMGHQVYIYTDINFKNHFDFNGDRVKFFPVSKEINILGINFDLNNALLYTNQSSNEVEELILNDIREIDINPEVIITISASTILRKIWPKTLILHYELGVFNRPPFPVYHQFDPGGYYHKSILSKFPSMHLEIDENAIYKMNKLRDLWLQQLNYKKSNVGWLDVIYVPLPSFKNWTVKSEISYKDRFDYLKSFLSVYRNVNIICNEKPQDPLSELERRKISSLNRVALIENKDIYGSGHNLVIQAAKTYCFSPSLSLQTLFWGNVLITHLDSSMYAWSRHPYAREQLASYFNIFNILEFSDIESRIDIWKKFNPYQ